MSALIFFLFLGLVIAAWAPARLRQLRRGYPDARHYADAADLRRDLDEHYR